MKKQDLDFLHIFFDSYVRRFYSTDKLVQQNIFLKEEHTMYVCLETDMICKALGLSDNRCYLAETCALFHDIGRFKQFAVYRTFNDAQSENHALLGVKVLKEAGILSCLADNESDLILKAVELHNVYRIPEGLSEGV